MASSGMLRCVVLVRPDVSEERSDSFIRVTGIAELGRTLAVTSNRRTLRRNTEYEYETLRYGLMFCGTLTREWQRWQSPVALVQVNYRPILSSERAPHTYRKTANV
jgi:hypothetical protein